MKGILAKLQQQGWRVTGSSGDPDDATRVEVGTVELERIRDNTYEVLRVPYTARFEYGEPQLAMSRPAVKGDCRS